MKQLYVLFLLLVSTVTTSAQEPLSYVLDFQQKIRPQFISDVTINGEKGYLFIQAISNYSPETYPNLITDVAIQQTMIGQNFRVLIKSDTDFNSVSISPPITNNMRNVIAVDGEVYFTSNDSVNEGGAVNFFKWGIDGILEVYTELPFVSGNMDGFITYYDNKFYFLTHQYYNQEIDEIILGKLFVLDLSNDQMTHYEIGDPTAATVVYKGIAVDETGIYVSGVAAYVSALTGITPSQDFYYTEGAFQPCMTCNTIAMDASFLTSYNTTNPEIRNWSTYVGGTGNLLPSMGTGYYWIGSREHPRLKIIDEELYMLDIGLGTFSNYTTPGVYGEEEGYGAFLMRFSTSGNLLMGTRLFNNVPLQGNVVPVFAYGEQSAETITIGFTLPSGGAGTNEVESTSPNASLAEPPGSVDLFISQFDSSGNRLFGTYWGGNLKDYHIGLVAEDKQFTGFFTYDPNENVEPEYEITSEDILLDYTTMEEDVWMEYSVVKTNNHVYRFIKGEPSSIETPTKQKIEVYPNPAENVLQINSDDFLMEEVVVYDLQGKEIHRFHVYGANHAVVDVSWLSKGLYLLQITGNNRSENIRFVKK